MVAAIEAYRFGIADQLPARLVEERQPDVEDDEVEVREVGGGAVHVPGLGVLDRLRAQRDALVHADQVDAEFAGLFEDRKRDARIVHPPRVRRPVVVAHVVELERPGAELADLALHQVERLASLQRVDRAPEDCPVRVAGWPGPRRSPRARARRGRGRSAAAASRRACRCRTRRTPSAGCPATVHCRRNSSGGSFGCVVGRQRVVERVEVVGEHLAGLAERVLRLEVEHVRDAVEHEHVVDHEFTPFAGRWSAT